jgi:hypothetical protein
MSQRKKPDQPRREKPLDHAALVRKATAMTVWSYREVSKLPPGEIRARVLADAKLATTGEPVDIQRRDVAMPGGQVENKAVIEASSILRLAAAQWGVMDDMKAERFYEIVEGCVDACIAHPDFSTESEASRRIMAGIV